VKKLVRIKKTRVTDHLSALLKEDFNYEVSGRSLRDYYNAFIKGEEPNYSGLSVKLTNALKSYVNQEGVSIASDQQKKPSKVKKQNGSLPLLVLLIMSITSLFVYQSIVDPAEKCMVWNGNGYEEISCVPKYSIKHEVAVVPYNAELVENFKRLDVDCDTPLYQNQKPIVWCFRVKMGQYDFFNFNSKHPITGDSLKPVSKHIKDNYICKTEQSN